jgi:hypothetical protein
VHFAAHGLPALRFTALLSGYPFSIPYDLPSAFFHDRSSFGPI